jgi:hypothetical protein
MWVDGSLLVVGDLTPLSEISLVSDAMSESPLGLADPDFGASSEADPNKGEEERGDSERGETPVREKDPWC